MTLTFSFRWQQQEAALLLLPWLSLMVSTEFISLHFEARLTHA
jgi:hypothetical protein